MSAQSFSVCLPHKCRHSWQDPSGTGHAPRLVQSWETLALIGCCMGARGEDEWEEPYEGSVCPAGWFLMMFLIAVTMCWFQGRGGKPQRKQRQQQQRPLQQRKMKDASTQTAGRHHEVVFPERVLTTRYGRKYHIHADCQSLIYRQTRDGSGPAKPTTFEVCCYCYQRRGE